MSKPKLIDFKLLNDELNIKMLSLKLDKSIQKINSANVSLNSANVSLNSVNVKTDYMKVSANSVKSPIGLNVKYNKISILFNLILGLIIISIPAYLYYRHKTKTSKFEKDKHIIDVVSKINNKIGINPEYKSLHSEQNTNKNIDKYIDKNIEKNLKTINNVNTNKNSNIRDTQYINLY